MVTGAAQGIGEACARLLSQEGTRLVIGDIRGDQVSEVAHSITSAGGIATDVSDPKAAQALIDLAVKKFGGVDVCVCNAGVSRPKPFLELTAEDWDATLRINLGGAFLVGQAAAKAMIAGS